MKHFFLALATLLLCVSCSDNTFKIEGNMANADQQMLYLEHQGMDATTILDSVRIKKNGNFSIKYLRPEYPDLYRLRLGKESIMIAIDSTETVVIDGDINKFATGFKVTNSLATEKIRQLRASSHDLQYLAQGPDSVNINEALAQHQQLAKNIIMENPRSMAAYYAIYQTQNGYYFLSPYDNNDLPFWSAVATQFQTYYPEYDRTKSLTATTLDAMRTKRQAAQIQAGDFKVQETGFIEIELPNLVGEQIKLSSLVGNLVLIDFSAYAMEQSSAHTLYLRELYARYHDRGLEIYQISLDPNKLLWMEKSRNLPWISVRDANAQNSRYLLSYNIKELPTFFLMDKEGNIIGRYNYDQLDNVIIENL